MPRGLTVSVVIPGKASRKNQKWRGPDENIRANLRQYETEKFYVDVLVSDSSKAIWRQGPLFDAIVTDRTLIIYHCERWHATNISAFILSN